MAGIWTALATAALFVFTIRYVAQSENKLTSFLQAIHQNDFSVSFSENPKNDSYDLHHAFNRLNEKFLSLRSEKESQYHLLQIIVEHAAVPLISFDESNHEVFIMNEEAKRTFNAPFAEKIESLRKADPMLPSFLLEVKDGEKTTFKWQNHAGMIFFSVTSQHLKFKEKLVKLVMFHDVSTALAAKEAETWQKLLRILTHEISNSAIPLSTLSSFIHDKVMTIRQENRELTKEERNDIIESLKAIDRRSKSLKEFVHNFKNVNQIPEPKLENLDLEVLIRETLKLYSAEFDKAGITIECRLTYLPPIFADKDLTQQVVINILKNACEALENYKEGKKILIGARKDSHRYVTLSVSDNGPGIPEEYIDQIFIPFFSTKKGGSGIGLSISKQIMQKQKGDISVQSSPGKGTLFSISFLT